MWYNCETLSVLLNDSTIADMYVSYTAIAILVYSDDSIQQSLDTHARRSNNRDHGHTYHLGKGLAADFP